MCFGSCLAIGKTESEKIRERLLELLEQFGVDVVVYENEDEIEHEVAKDAVRNGDLVEAYTTGNKVYFVASSFVGRGGIRRAEEVFVHEVVVHIGLEKLLGDKWTQFRSDIWQKMNEHEQRVFMEYAKDTNLNMLENELQLLAADEYLAHLSERFARDVLTPHEASVFDEIINFFMQIMETLGIRLSNQQCKTIFVASAQAMREAKESKDKANTESKPKETKSQTESKTKEKSDKEVKEEGNKENAKPKKRTDEVESKPKEEQTREPNKGEKRSKASRSTTDIEQVNDRFNTELQQQIDGTLPKGHVYQLGMPSDILRSAGIPYLPIEMASQRLIHKSNQENHPFDLKEVKNLPNAIHNPLAVFDSATHLGSNVILTELKQGNKNFVVVIQTNRSQGRIIVNSIRSIHPRTTSNIIGWINDGLMGYSDKKNLLDWIENKIKTRDYLNSSNPADVRNQLVSATNVVKDFENPSIDEEKVRAYGNDDTRFSRKMGVAKAQLADMKYGETVRMDALAQAKTMLLQGEPMENIFAQTGWKQQNMFGKPTWIYTEPELSAREKLDRFLKADRKSEIEMLTLGNKKLSELRAMLGDTINMKTFKSKLKEMGKSEEEVREDLADLLETFGKSDGNLFSVFLLYFSDKK